MNIVVINHHIILNAFNLNDLGLFRGKMGIVLYFYIYSRYNHEGIYADFASKLLSDLFCDINTQIPFFFDDGLCGIGWGIEYLVQNSYVGGDTNEILSDLDQFIMQIDPIRIANNTDENLFGLVYYIVTRLTSISRNKTTPFESGYLESLYDIIISRNKKTSLKTHSIFKDFIKYYQQPFIRKTVFDFSLLEYAPEIANINESNILTYPLGIMNGLTGACLKNIYKNE